MFKNKKLIKATTLVALGLGVMGAFNSNNVDAASWRISLKHAAAVYNYKGHRSSRHLLRRGTRYTAYRYKSIHGHKYVYIGRGRYIKLANTSKVTVRRHRTRRSKKHYLFWVDVTAMGYHLGLTYNKPNGHDTHVQYAGYHKVYETKTDSNGLTWYRLGKNAWVDSTDTNKPKVSASYKAKRAHKKTKSSSSTSTKPVQTTTDDTQNTSSNTSTTTTVKTTPVTTTTKATAPASTPATLTDSMIEEFNQEFLRLLNNWRASQGKNPVVIDYSMKSYAMQRAQHNAAAWDINKSDGDAHQGSSSDYGECENLVDFSDPKKMAKLSFEDFVYHDGDVNWGHRDNLANPAFNKMYIGLAMTHQNNYYKNGVAVNVDMDYDF